MGAQVVMLRASRPRLLRAAMRRLFRFRAQLSRLAALRRKRLVADACERFDERAAAGPHIDPRDDPRFHRWRSL